MGQEIRLALETNQTFKNFIDPLIKHKNIYKITIEFKFNNKPRITKKINLRQTKDEIDDSWKVLCINEFHWIIKDSIIIKSVELLVNSKFIKSDPQGSQSFFNHRYNVNTDISFLGKDIIIFNDNSLRRFIIDRIPSLIINGENNEIFSRPDYPAPFLF